MYRFKAGIFFYSLLLLAGCSPHSGSGSWVLAPGKQAELSKIVIQFEPKVDIYGSESNDPIQQCGWWAKSRQEIEMECVWLSDTNKKVKYQLNILQDDTAQLLHEARLIGEYVRQND